MAITGIEKVVGSIEKACDDAGEKTIAGKSLESPDPCLLDVRDGDFDEHVSMQPSAIAYYGVLRKQSARHLEGMKRAYDRWQKRKFQEGRTALEATGSKKPTIAEIESFVLMNNEAEVEKFEEDIESLREQADTMDVWYEAWRQKSFSLREHGQTLSDERRSQPYMYDSDEPGDPAPAPAPAKPRKQLRMENRSEVRKTPFDSHSSIKRIKQKMRDQKALKEKEGDG